MESSQRIDKKHRCCRHLQSIVVVVVCVFGACCTGFSGDEFDCPSSIVTDDTQLKFVSRKNQTQSTFCGVSLETICFRDLEFDKCRILLNLSVNLVEKGDKLVQSFEFHFLQTYPIIGGRRDIDCDVADITNNVNSSDKVQTVNWWLDYKCCDEIQSEETYFATLSVSYDESRSCEAYAHVKLKSESKEVNKATLKSSDNTSAEISLKEEEDLPSDKTSLVGVVAAVVIAVVGAVVTVVVVYIVYVKCSHHHCSNGGARGSQSEQAPLQSATQENCRICECEDAVVIPPGEDTVSCCTADTTVIPNITSSDEELTENQIDSGCFDSMLTDMRSIGLIKEVM